MATPKYHGPINPRLQQVERMLFGEHPPGGGQGPPVIIPPLTTAQRDAITATNGMLIYNSSLNSFQVYLSGAWKTITVT